MKPYKFQPYLKTTIWGGYQIAPFKNIYTAQPNIGESWEISGVPGHESVAIERGLVDDVDVGLNLVQLIDKYKGKLVGEKVYKKFGNKFPLLVKFIDSRQDLSVQVHPDDRLAMERHGCQGKTEMWYIIKSDVGAKIYAGLSKSITPAEYESLANAAALGEKKYGVAKDIDHFIMITLGTGVGSGIIVDGRLLYGHDGFAGELGHVIVRPGGRLCGCGRRGCLETYCSATGIVVTAKEKLAETDAPSVLRTINLESLTAKDIHSAAVMGDELAISIFTETGTILGEALADMVVFSNPEAIVLFGGLAKAGDFILRPTKEAMEAKMLNVFKGKTRLLLSELKDADAAILGASALA